MSEHDTGFIIIVCLWFVFFGACIGSFLNLFVHRFPRRKSLVSPPSHCPRCGHLIRWYDNVPVFGWIKLRGKCRDCRLPISVRYPCVEGFCGVLFGSVFILLDQLWEPSFYLLIGLTLFVSLLGSGVLAVGLIMYDKRNAKKDS